MVDAVQRRLRARVNSADALLTETRQRVLAVDVGLGVVERDRDAAGTLLGSALALRLFLFFVPLVLLTTGLAGFLGAYAGVSSVPEDAGISGSLAEELDQAFNQGTVTPWVAMFLGLSGVAVTGRSLSRALALSSALSWNLGGRHRTSVRLVGLVVGIVVGLALVLLIVGRIEEEVGLAIASLSFIAVAPVYALLWGLLFLALPRATPDPGAVVPGALTVAVIVSAMHAISQLLLPRQIDNAVSLYGAIGIAVATLGWFFFLGRALAFAFALNAVMYEQIGSISEFLFGLPGVRVLPRRFPALARFFDLETSDPR